jgi:hypothetical protein
MTRPGFEPGRHGEKPATNRLIYSATYLCLINQALRHEGVRWSECIDPRILELSTSWR